ncbi:MAG: hypothetical protein IJV71_02620 [Lachnospiraceae bacterium]|nr:hypothetical protein [Lachnospiraceae bacterium]
MSKNDGATAEAVVEPTVITEKKVKEKTKTKEVKKPAVPVMYVGPNIANVVQKSTVFKDGVYTEALNAFIQEHPYIKKLLVPIDSLAEARKELSIEKSALSVIYNKVKKL